MPIVTLVPTAEIEAAFRAAMIEGVTETGIKVKGEAQRMAPKAPESYMVEGVMQQPGRLRRHVECEIVNTPNSTTAIISDDMPYAEVQHEHTEFHHTYGEAKYIEKPIKRNVPILEARIRAALTRNLQFLRRP